MIAITKKVLEDQLPCEGENVLAYRIEYPEFHGDRYELSLALINTFYRNRAQKQEEEARGNLYDEAQKQYQYSVQQGYPILVYESQATYRVCLRDFCTISLYIDQYQITGGAHGSTIRDSQTWNLQKCWQIPLKDLLHTVGDGQQFLFDQVKKQIDQHPGTYFPDAAQLLQDTFDWHRYYCTSGGIVLYYQQYDIAPYASGIPEFPIPYSSQVLPPESTCFSS